MREHSERSSLERESEEGFREEFLFSEDSCCYNFEYIETFLPRNIECEQ